MRYDSIPATSLATLAQVLCHKETVPFFPNQVVMYQLLVAICGGNQTFIGYCFSSTDDLFHEIHEYVCWSNRNKEYDTLDDNSKERFSTLHKFIYENIANTTTDLYFDPMTGNPSLLSVKKLKEAHVGSSGNIESNISNILSGKRKIPKFWSKLIAKDCDNEYEEILQRIFWILQYYIAYYGKKSTLFHTNYDTPSSDVLNLHEYYSLSDEGRNSLYNCLSEYCGSYSKIISNLLEHTFDLYILSKIILDIIIDMVNRSQKIGFKRISDIVHLSRDIHVLTELDQFRFFQHSIDCYGSDSFDRYKIIQKYADSNCYAANELGLMYYWGKTLYISKTNTFKIIPDREKAIEYFQLAVNLSDPPLQSACWSLAYTIEFMGYDTEDEEKQAKELADKYYQLCEDYPPALTNRALRLLSIASSEYDAKVITYSAYIQSVSQALNLLFQSGESGWVFGYNNIAIFLKDHYDKSFIDDLCKNVNFELYDAKHYLEKSASMGNLWAMKHLAIHSLENGETENGRNWLLKGIEYGYAKAYYLMALHFADGNDNRRELLKTAAEQGEPAAAFDLGNDFYDLKDYESAKKWYHTCIHLIQKAKETNTSLYMQVKEKLILLHNETKPTSLP